VLAQGNPTTLPDRVRGRKVLGTILAVATTAFAFDKLGSIGAQAALGSGLTGDVYQVASQYKSALAPLSLNLTDFGDYKSVDVRNVTTAYSDRVGQIIIGYKVDRTPQIEAEAMALAILSVSGLDTTPDQVAAARADDLAARQAVWDACVAEGKCKND
jgi:hypothetical protein